MNKRIFCKYFFTFLLLISSLIGFTQCTTNIYTIPSTLDTINCGEDIQLQITLPLNAQGDNFSSSSGQGAQLSAFWSGSTINYTIAGPAAPNGCNPPLYCPLTAGLPANVSNELNNCN